MEKECEPSCKKTDPDGDILCDCGNKLSVIFNEIKECPHCHIVWRRHRENLKDT